MSFFGHVYQPFMTYRYIYIAMLEMVYELLYNGFKTGCGQTPRFARDTLNILYIMGHSGIPEKLRYGICATLHMSS